MIFRPIGVGMTTTVSIPNFNYVNGTFKKIADLVNFMYKEIQRVDH